MCHTRYTVEFTPFHTSQVFISFFCQSRQKNIPGNRLTSSTFIIIILSITGVFKLEQNGCSIISSIYGEEARMFTFAGGKLN